MTSKTYAQLTAASDFQDSYLLASWDPAGPGPLKSFTGTVFKTYLSSTYLQLSGSSAMTGTLLLYAGSQGSPGAAFATDTDTGFYSVGANSIGLSVGGVQVARWETTGETITGALAVSGAVTSPTITSINSSIAYLSTATNVTGISTSLTNVSSSVSQISSSLSNTNTSLSQVSSSLSNTNSSLSSTNSNVTKVSTSQVNISSSLANVSTSLTNVSSSVSNLALAGAALGFVTKSADYTMVLADANSTIFNADGTASHTFTIPAHTSVAYPTGTLFWFVADGASASGVTVAITTDIMFWYNGSSIVTGSRTVGGGGSLLAIKTGTASWNVVAGIRVT